MEGQPAHHDSELFHRQSSRQQFTINANRRFIFPIEHMNMGLIVLNGIVVKQFDNDARKEWVNEVESQNGPYANPVSLSMLEDPFWKEPSDFYGGQSFREMEGKGLENSSKNLVVTPQDAEADTIISAELEKYVAGDQSMDDAIANMQKNLEAKIGKATIE